MARNVVKNVFMYLHGFLLQLSFNRDVNFARFYMDLFASRAIAANVGSDLNGFFGDPTTEILIMPP